MSSTVFGLGSNAVIVNPSFRASRDEKGKTTATLTASIRRGDYTLIAPLLAKGESITGIYPDCDGFFEGLLVNDHDYEELAGGIDKITVNFLGYFAGDEGSTDREKVYSFQGDMTEREIILHPKYLEEVTTTNQPLIVMCYNGLARFDERSSAEDEIWMLSNLNGDSIGPITPANDIKWFNIIIKRGRRTYRVPVATYTVTETDLSALTDTDLERWGLKDTPPNSPPKPPNHDWMLVAATEEKSSDNPITKSRTWQSYEATADDDEIYDYTLTP